MQMTAPMECGFLRALAQKAVAGRLPVLDLTEWSDEDRHGVEHAHACIDLARLVGAPDFIYDEMVSVVDQTFNSEIAPGFVWAICVAAAAGALN